MKKYLLKLFFLLLPGLLMGAPADCEVLFSPKDQVAKRLVDLIDKEQKSIKVAIYCMTHFGIAKALIRAKNRGVPIEVIVDPFSVKSRSSIHHLVRGKIPLFVWDHDLNVQRKRFEKTQKPLMHDKFCIFGDRLVWTGSFNFTHHAASSHQENTVIIESREIAQKFLQQFAQMKLYESRPFQEYIALHPPKKKKKKPS